MKKKADAANAAQEKAEKEGKIIIKDSIADIFLQQILELVQLSMML
ncbi:hypothetical protein ACVXZ0_05170 [Staphylococcus aureus]